MLKKYLTCLLLQKGDITAGFAIVEGARNIKKGYNSFQEGCTYYQAAREMTNND